MTLPAEISAGYTAWYITEGAEFPLVFQAQLLLEGETIAKVELAVPLAEYVEPAPSEQKLQRLSSGVTVVGSGGEGQHPWVNIENFTTNCPASSEFGETSGTCNASFVIYNDLSYRLYGWAAYDLDLEPATDWPIWFSAETQRCRQGIYNGTVRCVGYRMQEPITGGTTFKAAQWVDMPPWKRISISKTISWTLDPSEWWVTSRSSLSSCSAKFGSLDGRSCLLNNGVRSQGTALDPINTFTGALDNPAVDLSLPTSAGDLVFQRSYSSQGATLYTTPLGYGWDAQPRHSIDLRRHPRRANRPGVVQSRLRQSVRLPRQRGQHVHRHRRDFPPPSHVRQAPPSLTPSRLKTAPCTYSTRPASSPPGRIRGVMTGHIPTMAVASWIGLPMTPGSAISSSTMTPKVGLGACLTTLTV